ncbi:MAG: DUF1844 domain-containing protein [Ignavibacteria bacterium]|nr:DUF1844 domain-containing protein [Ignavibacteria bacterium]
MDNKEKNTQLFMYLVGSFEMSAMMAMGKIKNPMTDKTERDLTQAQFSIDIMDMLKEKTKGQLSEYEAKFLENTLGQLKLNYIDESKKADEPAKVEESAKSEEEPKNTDAEK